MEIFVNVVNQKLKVATNLKNYVSGTQEFIRFVFGLSDDWDDLSVFAQFRQGSEAYNVYLDTNNSAYLPPEIGAGTCTLMLYGSHNRTRATTNYLTLTIDENILVTNADSTEISTSLYEQLVTRVNTLESTLGDNALITGIIQTAVSEELSEYLESGKLANIVIGDRSITRDKLASPVEDTLRLADSSMQPNVYDIQGLKTDIFGYARNQAYAVQEMVETTNSEIAGAYTGEDGAVYSNLGDAVRGATETAKAYTDKVLSEYESFEIVIVDALPSTGAPMTFYLLPNSDNTKYDKYWWIEDSDGKGMWDVFGGSSTEVVNTLPIRGESDVDYILNSNGVHLYYKWIDNSWKMISGSVASVLTELPETGNSHTDYYVLNPTGGYIHYRYISGVFEQVGSDSYSREESDTKHSELQASIQTINSKADINAEAIESFNGSIVSLNEEITGIKTSSSAVSGKVDKNVLDIDSLSRSLTSLQQEVNNLDTEGYTYYATYGTATLATGEEAENVFTLYEVKNEVETIKSQFIITGGSGGTTSATNLVVEKVTASPVIATVSDKVEIQINYSSTDSDGEEVDGSYTWKIGSSIISSGVLVQGLNTFDLTDYVTIGTQKLTLTVVDEGGSVAVKTWTVRVVDVRIESTFNDKITYTANSNIAFSYTPYGSVSKTVHFILDGIELESVVTSASGISQSYSLDPQSVNLSHGAHLLECYITAKINNADIETDHIFKDIICYDETSTVPVIGCIYRHDHYGDVVVKQYDTTNITYYVYNPSTGTPTVTHKHNDDVVATETLTTTSNTWSFKTDVVGKHTLVISCGDTSVTIVMYVRNIGIEIKPVTAGLAFDFNPDGYSNSGTNRLWSDPNTGVAMSVSDNFDWTNGGYQLDSDGNKYFCVKAGTTATINYNLFERDASVYGSEFKVIFKATNVRNVNATFLSCVNDTTPVGLRMDAHAAYLMTSATGDNPLYMPYCEDDIIEFEVNVNTIDSENAEATSLIMSYEDGTGFRPLIYDSTHRLYQYSPVPITIGSTDCDVHIYRMKVYGNTLSDSDILTNFIADARTSEEMLNRYYRNQIYDENNALTPESVAAACPDLKIIKIDCPYFTQDKGEMVKYTTVECIHKNGDPILDNWKAVNCYHSGQGTTSNEYGYAGRNMNIYMCFDGNYQHKKVTYDPEYLTELTLGDGTKFSDGTGKVTLTRDSVPNALFNIKVNIASSENANNALLAKRYHRYLPYTTVGEKRDPKVKTTMEFVNCVVFVRENDKDISTHREFQNTGWNFYAIGNIGDSKDTDQTRTNDPDDHNEFVIEISDNTKPNSIFPSGVTDENGKQVYPIDRSQWVAGNPAYDSLYGNWDETFEFRYSHPDITDEEEAANIQIWNDFYEWIITSADEEFVNELDDWTISDAYMYMYLFTERYTMIDNRAKNTFWHYGKVYISQAEATEMGAEKAARYTIDDEAAAIRNGYRFDSWNYDNDTALGINNSGEMTMSYGKEDIDYRTDGDPNSGYIYNAAESTFFCRIRDLMYDRLQQIFLACETNKAWDSTGLINEFDSWQAQFPEELWRLDLERKYYRTYQGGTRRFLETMMNGRKKYHRRGWERDQDIYMLTKYVGSAIKQDQIMFRCNTPQEAVVAPNYDLKIVPFSDMYIDVLYGNSATPIKIRAKAGVEYEILNPLGNFMDDTAILIYAASRIQALNDLSSCYIHDNDFSKATRLQILTIGNSTEGYKNTFLTNLNIGNNYLLKELNVRNCPNLVGSVNFTNCGNLVSFYAEGTSLTGVIFAPNGKIVSAYLPDTINSMSIRYLNTLTDLKMAYDNLESLTVEHSNVISNGEDDVLDIVADSVDTLQTLRLSGIDWELPDSTILNAILAMNSSVLQGRVYVSGAIRNQELLAYESAWPDLEVTYNAENLVTQYLVTYVNKNGEELYTTYVDRGLAPPDPVANGLIDTPTFDSTAQYDFTFAGWDEIETSVLAPRTVTALYTETIRSYTVRWFSRAGLSLGSTVANYGDEVVYPGAIPERTDEEGHYIYNLFTGWDKSTGFITGDIDVYAVWERAQLPEIGKELHDMVPAEIYGISNVAKGEDYFELKDHTDITLGRDFNFSNVESQILAENLYLDGKTAVNTGVKLFGSEERSFTLAIDFNFARSTSNNTLLACYEDNGSEGFRLRYNNSPNVQWGNVDYNIGYGYMRDMLVLRHKKGEDVLYVYVSNGTNGSTFSDSITVSELTRNRSTSTEATVVLGAIQFLGDGGYDEYGYGTINWCKIWFDDLGDTNARLLASWPHETIRMEFSGVNRYRLAGNTSQRAHISFVANNLLSGRGYKMNDTNTNANGWLASSMNAFCDARIYNALPIPWQTIIKKVKIVSSIGGNSTATVTSEDYVYIPAVCEVESTSSIPYSNEGSHISWYISEIERTKSKNLIIPDGHSTYSTTSDPSSISTNNVTEGDIWRIGGSRTCYIYVTQETIDRLGLTADYTATIGGGWITSDSWWLRSPYYSESLSNSNYFSHINSTGGRNLSNSASPMGVCIAFSV